MTTGADVAGGDYRHVNDGDTDFAAITVPHNLGPPSHSLSQVAVEQVAEITQRLPCLGGTFLALPMALPEVGTIAVARDPSGAALAFFQR